MILYAPENTNKITASFDSLIKFNTKLIHSCVSNDFISKINFRINNIIEIAEQIKAHILKDNTNFNVYNMKIKKEQIIIKSLLFLFLSELDSLDFIGLANNRNYDLKIYIELLNRINDIDIIDVIYKFYKHNNHIKIYMLDNFNIRIEYGTREKITIDQSIIINLDNLSCIHNIICNLIKKNQIIKSVFYGDNDDNNFIMSIFYLVMIGIEFEI